VLHARLKNRSKLVTIREMGLKAPRQHPRHRSFLKNLARIESQAKIKDLIRSVMNQVKSSVRKCFSRIRCQVSVQPLQKKNLSLTSQVATSPELLLRKSPSNKQTPTTLTCSHPNHRKTTQRLPQRKTMTQRRPAATRKWTNSWLMDKVSRLVSVVDLRRTNPLVIASLHTSRAAPLPRLKDQAKPKQQLAMARTM